MPPTARPALSLDSVQKPAALTVMHTTMRQSCATAAQTFVPHEHAAVIPRSAVHVWTSRSVRMPLDTQVICHLVSYFRGTVMLIMCKISGTKEVTLARSIMNVKYNLNCSGITW